jgi:hypothetical protein
MMRDKQRSLYGNGVVFVDISERKKTEAGKLKREAREMPRIPRQIRL